MAAVELKLGPRPLYETCTHLERGQNPYFLRILEEHKASFLKEELEKRHLSAANCRLISCCEVLQ